MLDVKSTSRGLLIPRMTQDQIESIKDPADGLIVYCTTTGKVYLFVGTAGNWKEMDFGAGIITPWTCGLSFTVNHAVAGGVAPVDKTVTYGTVTDIPGEPSKCWITSNLGADHQASAYNDATEASAGWYWQFNRIQGFKHDGTTRTPATTWISSINENLDWQAANDPCALELGSGWRIPTRTEWENVDAAGGWTDWNGPWNSPLKIHVAGYLWWQSNGILRDRGVGGYYWTSIQSLEDPYYYYQLGWFQHITSGGSNTNPNWYKAHGFSVRCVNGMETPGYPTVATQSVSHITQTSATGGGNITAEGDSPVTARGVCWSTSHDPRASGYHTTDGSGTGVFSSSITGLSANTIYYVRSYATNSSGTAYGEEVTLSTYTCGYVTVSHTAGDVAPVTKTVTYETVTNIEGETSKCWITQNLGSDRQATAVNENAEAPAGWYWQFNRKQGFMHDGLTLTPSWTTTSIDEDSDWSAANDPCALQLGTGWRIPTYTEWYNVDAGGSWTNWNGPWGSALKLHAAGHLVNTDGSLTERGTIGLYWSNSQYNAVLPYQNGSFFYFQVSAGNMDFTIKARALSVRCLTE
jgi:hypothetical protein